MTPEQSQMMTQILFGAVVVLAGLSFLFGGVPAGIGAAVGGTVSMLNWMAMRWIVTAIVGGRVAHKAAATVLLAGKLALLSAICWGLLTRFDLHPIGFAVGLSALFIAIGLGALVAPAKDSALAGEEA